MSLKVAARDLIPGKFQVPCKYYIDKFRGYLEPEMRLLKSLVHKGDLALDVGANRGLYTYHLHLLGANVIAFEPNPACAKVLSKWGAGKRNVSVYQSALSDINGNSTLFVPAEERGNLLHDSAGSLVDRKAKVQFQRHIVQTSRLDDLGLACAFIKVDVEGYEYPVFKGGEEVLKTFQPAILVEIEARHSVVPIDDTFRYLSSLGFQGFFFERGMLRDLDDFCVHRDQRLNDLGLPFGRYINNFLFLPVESLSMGRFEALVKGFS